MGTHNSNTIVKTSQRLEPDYEGKVKGTKVGDGVIIDFYIEYEDVMAPGDKISYLTNVEGQHYTGLTDGEEDCHIKQRVLPANMVGD